MHPDKNLESKELATRKFKEIAEAYDALHDPEKRKAYDRYGADGMQQMSRGQSHGGVNPDDLFQAFFGGADPLSELFGQGRGVRPGVHFQTFGAGGQQFQFGGNLFSGFSGFEGQRSRGRVNLPCTLEEVYNGTTKRVRAFGEACEVKVPAGSKAGDIIPNDRNSFKVDVLPHISYSLDGRNLLYTAVVHPHELLLGCKIKVRLLDATEKIVDFPGILEGRRLVIKGLGLPATTGARRGDLIITPSLLSPGLSSSLWAATKFGVILWLFMVMYSYPSLLFLLLLLKQFF